jgi:hypothetical protein
MERHGAIEDQAESRSRQEQLSSSDENAGLPIHGGAESGALPYVHACGLDISHWPGLLEELDVRFLVLDLDLDAELLEVFQARSGWVIDSRDGQAVLLAWTDTGPKAMASEGER